MADIEEPAWRDKHRIGELMNRLRKHSHGEVEMTATQLTAARLYLDKTLPSLAATTNDTKHSGKLSITWEE